MAFGGFREEGVVGNSMCQSADKKFHISLFRKIKMEGAALFAITCFYGNSFLSLIPHRLSFPSSPPPHSKQSNNKSASDRNEEGRRKVSWGAQNDQAPEDNEEIREMRVGMGAGRLSFSHLGAQSTEVRTHPTIFLTRTSLPPSLHPSLHPSLPRTNPQLQPLSPSPLPAPNLPPPPSVPPAFA